MASVIILFAVLISGVRLTVPLLNYQRDFFERWASHALHQPVHIGQITTSWYGFNPALTFQKVIITDPHQQSLLRINQLSISVNLFQSLIHWRLYPGHVLLSGARFNVIEGKAGKLTIEGMVAKKEQTFAELGDIKKIFLWLFTQSNITLKNIDIHYHTADGQLIPLTDLRLKVTNGILHHQIAGVGRLSQTVPTQFRFLVQGSLKNAELYMDIKNLVFSQWESSYFFQKYGKKFSIDDGRGNLQLWAKFKNDQLQSVQSLVKGNRIRVTVANAHSPLLIDHINANLYWQPTRPKEKNDFELVAAINQTTFHYHSGWPPLRNLKATLIFSNNQLRILADHADIAGNPLDHLKAVIPNFKNPILTVTGHSATHLTDGFKFLNAAPLSIAKKMQNTLSRGRADLNLKLTIPLGHPEKKVIADGRLTVKNGQFSLKNWGITLNHINGHFHFVNQNFSADRVFAKWLGMPIAFHIATLNPMSASPVLQLEMSGQLDAQQLQKKLNLPFLSDLKGTTAYRALLNLHGENSSLDSLSIATNLTGIQSSMPAPYTKLFQAPALLTSHFAFSDNKLSKIEVHYQNASPDAATSLFVSPVSAGWSVDIQNPLIAGHLLIPNRGESSWQGHFSRLYLPKLNKEKKQWNPQALPPLELTVDNLHYGKKAFGKLALHTSRTEEGLRIDKLAVTAPLFDIYARGEWQMRRGQSQTTLLGNFTSLNLGALLKQWKLTHALEGGAGRADFSIKWPGSPDQFNTAHLNGNIKLNFHNGRVTELTKNTESELGFGRLLNLFSLQSLPKLPLNLANLSKKGFAFNFFKGQFLLSKGVAKTQNMSLAGDVAWVQIKGLIGLADKNYDLHLQVVPNITSTLPLIVGLVGGPLAGAITWVANKILAPHVGKAAQVNYHIVGSWNKPKITLPAPAETDYYE